MTSSVSIPTMSSFRAGIARQPLSFLHTSRRLLSSSARFRKEVQEAYVISAARTPVGTFNGSLASVPAPQLAGTAIKAALSRVNMAENIPTSAYIGNVLSANVGQAPARQAVLAAGLPTTIEATTINKVCSSGLKSVAIAAQQIALGQDKAVIAGGMENMSRVPYYYPRAGQLPPFGAVQMLDGMVSDGLWDVYNNVHMGNCAENTAKTQQITREAQDAFAIESYRRAQEAWKAGKFSKEICPVTVKSKKGETVVSEDEGYSRLNIEKVPKLKSVFVKDGTITAANSSSFNDGASALVLGNADMARKYGGGSHVLARIVSTADAAVDPIDFPIAPAKAVPIALERAGLRKDDIAAWEMNEAFAAVVVANARILGMSSEKDMEKINPLGGAIALGHAIGSSGSRILITMLHYLESGQYGCVAICNGGGAASAMIVQRIDSV